MIAIETFTNAPNNNTLAPVLNKGTLDLSDSKLNDFTLNTIQITPTSPNKGIIKLKILDISEDT